MPISATTLDDNELNLAIDLRVNCNAYVVKIAIARPRKIVFLQHNAFAGRYNTLGLILDAPCTRHPIFLQPPGQWIP